MNKLNVTEGEWSVEWDDHTTTYNLGTDTEVVSSRIYDEQDAILMSQSKKLYEQLETTNKELAFVIFMYNKLVRNPCEFFDAETCHLNQILLAQCRGEQPTCKN